MKNPLNPGYFTENDLIPLGFAAVGKDVTIAKNCVIPTPSTIRIGSHVRIDGFTVITGQLAIGSYVHIGPGCSLIGGEGITFEDFSTISHGVKVFTRSDDFSGEYMTNPMVPSMYTNVLCGAVSLGRHVVVGAGTVILPGSSLGEGVAVGALSLVRHDLAAWQIYAGVPCRKLSVRSRRALDLESKLQNSF